MSFQTNIGIEMEGKAFEDLVRELDDQMTANSRFDTQGLIKLVRTWNTLQSNRISDRSSDFKRFSELFRALYADQAVQGLDMTLTKGMAWYSRKYDLYFGGSPHPNSQYKLPQSFLDSLFTPGKSHNPP